MNGNYKLALYFVLILAMVTILLCTESTYWFSFSIAMIFTSTGVLIGQFIKYKKYLQISVDKLWISFGLFLLAIALSLCFYFLLDSNHNRITYIAVTNIILAICSIASLSITKQNS